MGTATDSWPALIIEQAVANAWCTKTICTTRGAYDFRRAVWAEAAVQIGRSFALQRGEWPNRKLLELPVRQMTGAHRRRRHRAGRTSS
jgi:hypothetical protein